MVAWAVIPLKAAYAFNAFRYSSWNLFLTLCSLPSILLALWLTRFPESPKFLLECGEFDEALECLKRIYRENTGEPEEAYPVRRTRTGFYLLKNNTILLTTTIIPSNKCRFEIVFGLVRTFLFVQKKKKNYSL